MKRYYLDKLTLIQSIIKSIILNIIITIIILVFIKLTKIDLKEYLYYVLGVVYLVVIVSQVVCFTATNSFYIKDNTIFYSTRFKEKKIELTKVTMIEEYIGLNYIFGLKTIILHLDKKRYKFLLKKNRADIFKNELETKLNNEEVIFVFNI